MINLGLEIGPTVALSPRLDWIQGRLGLVAAVIQVQLAAVIQVQRDTPVLLLQLAFSVEERNNCTQSHDDLYGVTRVAKIRQHCSRIGRVQKNHNILRKNTIFNEHLV